MNTYNNQNLLFSLIYLATSAISYLQKETISLISSLSMALLFLMIYIIFIIAGRRINMN